MAKDRRQERKSEEQPSRQTAVERAASRKPTQQMWKRALISLFGFIMVVFLLIIARLAVLQLWQTEDWQRLATEQQLSDSMISPNRGTIYDANGETLAESMQVWTIIMSPYNIDNDDERRLIADELSVLLSVDREDLYEKTTKTNSQYEIVKKKIERPLAEQLIEWVDENDLNGVFRVITDYKRTYPYGSLLSCVMGFTGTDNYGLYGLEAEYESVLKGKSGRIVTAQNGWGAQLPNSISYEKTVDAEDGNSLVLSIDQTIQHYAEKYLEQAVLETGATNRASAIVMNPNTGAIYAMATKGDYDPNEPMTITDQNELTAIAALSGEEATAAQTAAREKQWTNKAVSEYYEPGSVFKMFTSSMALEEGLVTENSTFVCASEETVLDTTVHCHVYPDSHGTQTLADAICNSCNPAFMQIGLTVGRDLFYKYFTGFGFTELTGIDMLSEAAVSSSLYHTEDDLDPVQLAVSSMGQTFKITPIQMITGISAIANGGKLLQPYVVQQVLDADGNVVSNTVPTVKRQVISEETVSRVAALLANAVENGCGKNAYVAGYRVAGKTGTSEKTETGGKNVVASFGGFAPADDPQIAVLVLIDEPHCANRYGGTIAAPVAKKIIEDTLTYLGVEPQYSAQELSEQNCSVPSVEGMEISLAEATIASQELEARVLGEGTTVIKQVPEAGQSIPAGGTIVLYTDQSSTQTDVVTVPDFSGYSLSEASNVAAEYGLNIQFSGTGLESGEASVSSQSVAAGTEVPYGTIVVVEFIYQDQIE